MRARTSLAVVAATAAATVGGAPAAFAGPVTAGSGCPRTDGLRVVNTPATYRRTVALTFDDGPDPTWTPQVLAVLRRHGVHGTFFVVGRQARAQPKVLAEVVADGNVIGNHTWDHPTSGDGIDDLTEEQLGSEIDRTERLLRDTSGQPVCFFRAPQGRDTSPQVREAAVRRGLTVTNMHSAHDYAQPDHLDQTWIDRISRRLIDRGDHPVLLLHDGGDFRGNSVAALDRVITWYAERGYVFTDPAGRPFPDDPAAVNPPTGHALPPTREQRRQHTQRAAEQKVSEAGQMTNSRVPEPDPTPSASVGTGPTARPGTDPGADPGADDASELWPTGPGGTDGSAPAEEPRASLGRRPAIAGHVPV